MLLEVRNVDSKAVSKKLLSVLRLLSYLRGLLTLV